MSELSDREKRLVNNGPHKPKPQNKQTQEQKELAKLKTELPDCKPITWRTGAEWQCPFCKRAVSAGMKQCGSKMSRGCSAYRVVYGKLDFAYKTSNGRIADTESMSRMKSKIRDLLNGT